MILKPIPIVIACAAVVGAGGIGMSVDMPDGYVDVRLYDDCTEGVCDEVPSPSHAAIERKADEGDAVARAVVRLHEAALAFTKAIDVSDLSLSREQANEACNVYRAEYAEGFWAPKLMFWIDEDARATRIEVSYLCDAGSVGWCRERLCGRIREALSWTDETMDQTQKLKALHDWLASHCQYDIEEHESGEQDIESMSAWGALVGGSAVCSGYAYAYRLLCLAAGIECEYVQSDEMNHAWNIVKIVDERYHVDVCWDDPVNPDGSGDLGVVEADGFLKSDEEMRRQGYSSWDASGPCADTSYDRTVWKTYNGPAEQDSRHGLDLSGLFGFYR